MQKIDCRGLSCPEPVLRVKKALEENEGAPLQVLVDNDVARDNILRFARNRGLQAGWRQQENEFVVDIGGAVADQEPGRSSEHPGDLPQAGPGQVILISPDQLGQGSEELGRLLMRNFIYTLARRDRLPRALIFMNSGVKLCTSGSAVLEELKLMQSAGVEILACGTCLDYFGLKESLNVGAISNMYDIVDLLLSTAVLAL